MNIRAMSTQDYDPVFRLWSTTPGISLNNLDDSREAITRYLARNPGTSFVAVRGEDVIGVIMCGHDGRRGFIYHMTVAVNERNNGVGDALLSAAMSALEKEGINKVALVVFSSNITGNDFWEKRGFSVRRDLVYRNKEIKVSTKLGMYQVNVPS